MTTLENRSSDGGITNKSQSSHGAVEGEILRVL